MSFQSRLVLKKRWCETPPSVKINRLKNIWTYLVLLDVSVVHSRDLTCRFIEPHVVFKLTHFILFYFLKRRQYDAQHETPL